MDQIVVYATPVPGGRKEGYFCRGSVDAFVKGQLLYTRPPSMYESSITEAEGSVSLLELASIWRKQGQRLTQEMLGLGTSGGRSIYKLGKRERRAGMDPKGLI